MNEATATACVSLDRGDVSAGPVSHREQVERESHLAKQLLEASDGERQLLYGPAYDEIAKMHLPRRGPHPEDQLRGARPGMIGRLVSLAPPGSRVLEVGCGTGYIALELAKRGCDVTAIDVSAVGIEEARSHFEALNDAPSVTFEVTVGTKLAYPSESFDVVLAIEVFEHLHERDVPAHLAEVLRVLRPGGRYFFWTPNRLEGTSVLDRFGLAGDAAGLADVHLREWTYGELAVVMGRAGFERLRSPWRNVRMHWIPPLPLSWKLMAERLAERGGRRRRRLVMVGAGLSTCAVLGSRPER